jgi:hypothetical protein
MSNAYSHKPKPKSTRLVPSVWHGTLTFTCLFVFVGFSNIFFQVSGTQRKGEQARRDYHFFGWFQFHISLPFICMTIKDMDSPGRSIREPEPAVGKHKTLGYKHCPHRALYTHFISPSGVQTPNIGCPPPYPLRWINPHRRSSCRRVIFTWMTSIQHVLGSSTFAFVRCYLLTCPMHQSMQC